MIDRVWLIAATILLLSGIINYTNHIQINEDRLSQRLVRLRNDPIKRGVANGVLLAIASLGLDQLFRRVETVLATGDPLIIGLRFVEALIAVGIGLSVGKAIVVDEYSWWEVTDDARQQT